ncbi:hypothetical protein [Nitrosomonas sp. Nm33]|uniref:hypothetical protein n=1 Tax=Nitrosomonas sp. Nm33 TaxID=133724 RepID=UPI000897579F|nr:hypothetical protein [Nitrosomonas sp. Nm33]SDY50633.1 hypothetical protein SAMN05421755_102636 [Nitrosomonas sp. Nm33]
MQPNIRAFFDPATWTGTYGVFDERSGGCAIIDPVLDYVPIASRTKAVSADKLITIITEQHLTVNQTKAR